MGLRKRIVVVDDDPKVRQLFEHVLGPPEFESFVFSSGTEALRRLPEIRPDCVVSDIMMPAMDGETLLRSARDLPGLERLPFIIISALRSEGRIRSVLDAGATAFLQKPFPLRQLLEKIRALVERPQAEFDIDLEADGSGSVIPFPAAAVPAPTFAPTFAAPPPAAAPRVAAAQVQPRLEPVSRPTAGEPRRIELPVPPTVRGFGCFTQAEWEQRTFLVLTEHVPRPHFKITTLVTEDGVSLGKVESQLGCPLGRDEDRAVIREQVELQHEHVLERLAGLASIGAPRRNLWPDHRRSIDPGLLAWALSAIAKRAEARLGREATIRLLLATRARSGAEAFANLEVTAFGRVVVDLAHGTRLPRPAVHAVARWCASFTSEAFGVGPERAIEEIREATRTRVSELDGLSFYDKLA